MKEKINYLTKSGIFGLVVADALGVPYEFESRRFCDENPMIDMIGYGTYNQAPGTWSDDSSMALATLDGLINSFELDCDEQFHINNFSKIINYEDIMEKFVAWLFDGEYTPYGEVFDHGNTTYKALANYKFKNCEAILSGGKGEKDNGNGSLMRILPIAYFIYWLSLKYSFDEDDMMEAVHNLSSLTHRHKRSQMACGIYVLMAIELLKNAFEDKDSGLSLEEIVNNGLAIAKEYYYGNDYFKHQLSHFDRVFSLSIQDLPRDEIQSGGYVISTLEASIWCLLNNDSYRETALAAVNLGKDTDTTACVVGGLAGIYYGYDGIPSDWLEKIARFDFIEELIDNFSNYGESLI